MKVTLLAIPLMLALCVASARAEDKPAMAKPAAPAAPAGKDGTWTGMLVAPQGNGVAVLKIKADKDKKDDIKEAVLWADTAELRSQIDSALKKHATVQVSGTLAADNMNVKVTSVTVEEKKRGKGK